MSKNIMKEVIKKYQEKRLLKKCCTRTSKLIVQKWCKDLDCDFIDLINGLEKLKIKKESIIEIDDDLHGKLWLCINNSKHRDEYILEKQENKLYIAKMNLNSRNMLKQEVKISA